jgi:hypothetical protein
MMQCTFHAGSKEFSDRGHEILASSPEKLRSTVIQQCTEQTCAVGTCGARVSPSYASLVIVPTLDVNTGSFPLVLAEVVRVRPVRRTGPRWTALVANQWLNGLGPKQTVTNRQGDSALARMASGRWGTWCAQWQLSSSLLDEQFCI